MRLKEILLRGIRRFSFTRIPSQLFVKKMVLNDKGRKILNSLYRSMKYKEREIFHSLYAKIFRNTDTVNLSTTWKVNFGNSVIEIPIDGDSIWLHWDTAISIVGHDIEIKQFYERLLESDYRPKTFFDIGANYGTHSILFLANQIRTVTFEPNPYCKNYFDQLAQQNNLSHDLYNVALSDTSGSVHLIFPDKDTWLGSISEAYQNNFKNFKDVTDLEVPAITLDEFINENKVYPDLIKIDTEGFEMNILKGGTNSIKSLQPLIVFESNKESERAELLQLFTSFNFVIYDLIRLQLPLDDESFLSSASCNFLAISTEHELMNDMKNFG